MPMQIKKTVIFATEGWFVYGQGDDIVGCFADALGVDNVPILYPNAFDIEYTIQPNEIVNTEEYCVCYDDEEDYGQKAFFGNGLYIRERLLDIYYNNKIKDTALIFPMSKVIKTKDLETEIRNNHASYKKVADWIGEEDW